MKSCKCERCGETYLYILFGPCKRCRDKEAKAPDQADEPDPDDERDLTEVEAKMIADTMMGRGKADSLGLMHDRVHKDVGRSRTARTARGHRPKCSCTPGGGYGCACPGCEGAKMGGGKKA